MTAIFLFNRLKVSIVTLFLLIVQMAAAQPNFTAVDQYLETQKAGLGPDGVVLVASADTVLYSKFWGSNNARAVVPLGSSSAWLTTALILQLVDEGKLSLDDKVARYLPVFERYGKNFITLRHCLTHQTGITDESKKLTRLLDKKKFTSLEDLVESYAAREIETNPGTASSYNDMGIAIAGRVAEVVLKKRFDLLIKQKLLTPLGMRQTNFTTVDGSAPNPATGARGTAPDMMRFLRMLLHGGRHNGVALFSADAVAQLRTLQGAGLPAQKAPHAVGGFAYTFGAWAFEKEGATAQVLGAPNFAGLWPVVDFCRGIAVLVLAPGKKEAANETVYGDLKKLIDAQFKTACR